MRQLFFMAVIWGLSCSLVSATEGQTSIYELAAIELPEPPAVVETLVTGSEPGNTEQKQDHLMNGHRLFSQTHTAPFLPLKPTSSSDEYYRLLRQWDRHLAEATALKAMAEKPKRKSRGLLFTGGTLLLSKLEELTASQIRQQEDFRFLNLYHGYRQR
ncbi:hypothetical protein Pan153_46450 [Gimesia panareensis]|uniref:Uncharacterized protein n=1 Tax=Gimesia panareensis TaxID=2527978 RepID=A0A518FUF7_9PLAN|nr:hypothetical protein [Gimesia panareensis]QDV19976.1 hypothetical protein Pan153_46450 [Gimesia panareensis]